MGKNKKKVKKAQMFSNFLAFKLSQGNIQKPPACFQTPHSEQDKLTELIDDNSPNLGANQATQIKPSGSGSNNPPQVNRWTALKPVVDPSIKPVKGQDTPPLPKPIGQAIQTTSSAQQAKQYSNKMAPNTAGVQQYYNPAETVKTGPIWAPNPLGNTQVQATHQYQPNTGSGWPKQRQMALATPLGYWPAGCAGPEPIAVQTDGDRPQAYSPSDIYSEATNNEEATDDELDLEMVQAGTKRLSAFQRLGPIAEQPKQPKLTINLLCQKDIREVVDESEYIPTHLRDYIVSSTDETVVKYREVWPYREKIVVGRTVSYRQSKSVMILETEQMEEIYSKDSRFIQVSVTGYPHSWKKEDVLEAVLKSVEGKSFIPCFIEFSRSKCKFLVIRSRLALLDIHKYGFKTRSEGVELMLSLSSVHLYLNHLDFVPRLILRKVLLGRTDGDNLDLSEFTTKVDISHFIYFPLSRIANQLELIQLQSAVPWDCITSLNLSRNNITSVSGLDLYQTTPKLRHLDLSYNRIEKVTSLLQCRHLPLRSIRLEGNPLCHNYIEQEHYIQVLTMLFSGLEFIDGVSIKRTGQLPMSKRNCCPQDAMYIVGKLLEVMFPLLDATQEQRYLIQNLYHEDAVLTVTYYYKLRYGSVFKDYRSLFNRARVLDEGEMESISGASTIAKVVNRWPDMMHDPATFSVDVMFHSDTTTIVKIAGILKITAESLANDEHILSFTRTIVLNSKEGVEYKIMNEMLYWDLPDKAYAETAFKITRVKPKNVNIRLDAPPDYELKDELLKIFMQITQMEKKPSERYLESQEWNLRNALEYFFTLLKLNKLTPFMKDP